MGEGGGRGGGDEMKGGAEDGEAMHGIRGAGRGVGQVDTGRDG